MRETIALRTDRLKAIREKHGLSQRELGRVSGVGETIISKYERGEFDPSSTSLKLIAEALGASTDYLLGLTDDPRGYFDAELTDDERTVVSALRRGGWSGVIRVAAERVTG